MNLSDTAVIVKKKTAGYVKDALFYASSFIVGYSENGVYNHCKRHNISAVSVSLTPNMPSFTEHYYLNIKVNKRDHLVKKSIKSQEELNEYTERLKQKFGGIDVKIPEKIGKIDGDLDKILLEAESTN